MVQVLRGDFDTVDLKGAFLEFHEADVGGHVVELNGEVRVFHLAGDDVLELFVEVHGAVDREFVAGDERGHEEGEAVDVVPVGMAEEDVGAHGAAAAHEVEPEFAHARAKVDNEQRAVFGLDFDAGGVAAVANGIRSGRWDGAANPPEFDFHVVSLSGRQQNIYLL